jgi:RHS repeat-associated protein
MGVTAIKDNDGKVVEANIYGPFGETEFSYDRARISMRARKYPQATGQGCKATLHKVLPEKRAELLVDPFLYSSDNRYTYTGQEQDEFGGLIYYNARWYDAEVGRFISEDPAAANPNDPLTINRYIYCRNNPLIYTDPTGEIFGIDDFVFIAICALVAGIGHTIDAMTNPKNEWHGGNYNDAFWSGFWKGAKIGQTIVAINNVIESFSSVAKTADGMGSQSSTDINNGIQKGGPEVRGNKEYLFDGDTNLQRGDIKINVESNQGLRENGGRFFNDQRSYGPHAGSDQLMSAGSHVKDVSIMESNPPSIRWAVEPGNEGFSYVFTKGETKYQMDLIHLGENFDILDLTKKVYANYASPPHLHTQIRIYGTSKYVDPTNIVEFFD